MTTAAPMTPPVYQSADIPRSSMGRDASARAPVLPPVGEIADEIRPLIGVVPVAGPPIVFLAGPWLLLALALAGPFLLLVTFVLIAASVLALACALFATAHALGRLLHMLALHGRRLPRPAPLGLRQISGRRAERAPTGLAAEPGAASRADAGS